MIIGPKWIFWEGWGTTGGAKQRPLDDRLGTMNCSLGDAPLPTHMQIEANRGYSWPGTTTDKVVI